jgi:hypothetical protein
MVQPITTPKTDKVLRRIAASDAAMWTETHLRLETGGAWSFDGHVYQLEPLSIIAPKISIKKAAQLGMTLVFICKTLWAMVTGRTPAGVIVLFPTDKKVTEFSETRWGPFLRTNAVHLGRWVKSTNNKHNKRIRAANLMFRGAKTTQRIGGIADESSALRSDPADIIVRDECDLHPPASHEMAKGRMLHSQLQWDWSLSNPTIPGFAIDAEFEAGDQRYWMIRCSGCNQWWAPDYEFPTILRRRTDGSVYLGCLKCGKVLDPNLGEWLAFHPERSKDHVSYMMSQMIRPQKDLRHLLDAYENPPDGDLANVMRFKFGRAYIDSSLALSSEQVLLCCTSETMWTKGTKTAIGVDVGPHHLHCVIGRRLDEDSYQVGALAMVQGWPQLANLFRQFGCEVASIDNEPEVHMARDFQAKQRSEVWLSDYIHTTRGYQYDQQQRVIRCSRNEILDETHFRLSTAGKLRLPAVNSLVKDFAVQCSNLVKVIEKKPGTGDPVVTYVQRGPDHWRHALANFLLAARRQHGTVSVHDTPAGAKPSNFTLFE